MSKFETDKLTKLAKQNNINIIDSDLPEAIRVFKNIKSYGFEE